MRTFTLIVICFALTAGACSSSRQTSAKENSESTAERDGSSYEKAVLVKSISAEYEWLRKNYPGFRFIKQALVENKGKRYDILSVQLADGSKKDFYFDINSFYGKF